ncbi:MAG TPA: hypothetical protein VFA94_07730 [Acidimicrobiales bacterium]|nr:hypothetical protein [Acidimicrobiales bacterium]
MRKFLIVANQTLGGSRLAAKVRASVESGSCGFHVVVPATRQEEFLVWTEGRARAVAALRLQRAIDAFEELGADVSGNVGDESPVLAVFDAMRREHFDEILLSTLPPGLSRWLRLDLPGRLRRRFSVPISLFIAERPPLSDLALVRATPPSIGELDLTDRADVVFARRSA